MPKQKGGKMKAKEVKDFLNASYEKSPPNNLDGYILDKSLSTDTAKVYYNPQTNHAVVAHRGTQGALDWGNNLAYAVGAYNLTSRYKKGKSVQDKAEKKYGKQNISTLGHSQGAVLARKLGTDTKEVINVNPAYTGERPARNEYNVRSSTDVVSGLYAPVSKTREFLFPKYSEKHDITIPSQSTFDVLGEHSYDILDRLGDKEIGVGAGNKISSNNIMYKELKAGKRYSRLGYTGEDIDWIGAGAGASIMLDKMNPQNRSIVFFNEGQLVAPPEYYSDSDVSEETLPSTFELSDEEPTGGAVGTPYVNRGTNPYGTRGAGFHDGKSSIDKYFKPPKGLRRGAGMSGGMMDDGSTTEEEISVGGEVDEEDVENFINEIEEMNINTPEINFLLDQLGDLIGFLDNQEVNEDAVIIMNHINQVIQNLDSDVEESDEEVEGGKIKKPSLKSIRKGFTKMGSTLSKATDVINPMSYAIKDKGTRDAMIQSGVITHDYALPAVVSAGKPIYDATAIVGSTMLTGNPVLGKAVADTLWNEMVAKPGYDPRQNQKSKELGELSSTFGQAVSKPYSASLGGMGRDKMKRYRLKAGMEGGNLLDLPDELFREAIENLDIQSLVNLSRSLTTHQHPQNNSRRQLVNNRINRLRASSPPPENIISQNEGVVQLPPPPPRKGRGRDGEIDFEDIKWGSFTRMFKEFKKENPKARVKDLEAFAKRIIKNKKKFSDKAIKKANFYINFIKK